MGGTLPRSPPATGPGDWIDFDAMDPIIGPLDMSLWFVRMDTMPPPQQVPLSGSAGALARGILLGNLPEADRDMLNAALQDSLFSIFDASWERQKSAVQAQIQASILEAAPDANITRYYLPERGQLRGSVQDLTQEVRALYPSPISGHQLNMIYRLDGIAAKFHSQGIDLFLKI
jgi:hypothetical protein